jgi:AcrR family transcriptional regulator
MVAFKQPEKTRTGLRERKKQRTRQTVVDRATRLFADQGYDETTLAEIAEAAEISPSTFFNYFASKSDIMFELFDVAIESARARVLERPLEESAAEAVLAWLTEEVPKVEHPYAEAMRRIPRVIASVPELVAGDRLRYAILEDLIATAFARDLDEPADGIRARVMAAITMGAIGDVWRLWYAKHVNDAEFDPAQALPFKAAHVKTALEAASQVIDVLPRPLTDIED